MPDIVLGNICMLSHLTTEDPCEESIIIIPREESNIISSYYYEENEAWMLSKLPKFIHNSANFQSQTAWLQSPCL